MGMEEDGVPAAESTCLWQRNGRGSKIGSGKGNSRARGGGGSSARWCAAGGQRNGEKNGRPIGSLMGAQGQGDSSCWPGLGYGFNRTGPIRTHPELINKWIINKLSV
jgi:hypothetical protein